MNLDEQIRIKRKAAEISENQFKKNLESHQIEYIRTTKKVDKMLHIDYTVDYNSFIAKFDLPNYITPSIKRKKNIESDYGIHFDVKSTKKPLKGKYKGLFYVSLEWFKYVSISPSNAMKNGWTYGCSDVIAIQFEEDFNELDDFRFYLVTRVELVALLETILEHNFKNGVRWMDAMTKYNMEYHISKTNPYERIMIQENDSNDRGPSYYTMVSYETIKDISFGVLNNANDPRYLVPKEKVDGSVAAFF